MLNYELLREKMKEKNLDAVVAISPENVLYSTGSWIPLYKALRERLAIVLIPINENPILIVCGIEENIVKAESRIKDIRSYREFKESPVDYLINILKEKKLEKGNIGIEKDYFPIQHFEKLYTYLSDITFTACNDIFEKLRMIKSDDEIELLSFAAKATHKAIEAAFLSTREGDREKDLANRIRSNLFALGANEIDYLVLGVGERGRIAHPIPGEFRLKKGEIVRLDIGAIFKGYYSDLGRTACIGAPSSEQSKIYRTLMEIHRELIQNMTIGKKSCDIFNLSKELFLSKGLSLGDPMPLLGHGVGIGLHENPIISPVDKNTLKENMVITVEPFYLAPEGYGYHVEDTLLIQPNGPKVLTESNLSDQIPVIG